MHPLNGLAAGVIVAALGGLSACQRDASALAAAGATSNSAFLVGPQPGPDRPIARPVNPYAGNTAVLAGRTTAVQLVQLLWLSRRPRWRRNGPESSRFAVVLRWRRCIDLRVDHGRSSARDAGVGRQGSAGSDGGRS